MAERIETVDAPLLAGRPARMALLDYGLFRVAAAPPRDVGLPGFAIETDRGERLLVDLGLPARYAADPAAGGRDGLDAFGRCLDVGPANLPAAQLALCGLAPGDVDAVLLTHTHIDHAGDLRLEGLRDVPWIIGAAERAMDRPLPLYGPVPDWPDRDWRTVAREVELAPGLTAIPAPGHAPGQLALLVRLPEGAVMLVSDAASRPEEVADGFDGYGETRAQAAASAAMLLARARAEGATVIWGHGPDQWARLPKAPARLLPSHGDRV
ncbi:MAG: MBL fold metallo-hydrolase [Hasllibacter sp.]